MTFSDMSPFVSGVALLVSLFTFWFTVLRRGNIRSTHPAFIAVRYDFVGKAKPQAKIFLRLLLFSTGKRGQVVESLSLRVISGSRAVEFSFWGYGDKDLVRGSGLHVPETGVATNHHFNPTDVDSLFKFSGGPYSLELIAKLVGRKAPHTLWKIDIDMPVAPFATTISQETTVFFNWSPAEERYVSSVEARTGAMHTLASPGR